MIMYKCDRCGKIQAEPFDWQIFFANNTDELDDDEMEYDLCDDCAKSFETWLHTYEKYDAKGYYANGDMLLRESE